MEPTEEIGKEKVVRRSPRPYPGHTLEEAITVARAIQENNAGKPMKRLLLADAIGRTPGSSEFRLLLSSAFKYGLTNGTEKSEYIELAQIGQSIVKPTSDIERKSAYVKAAINPEFFKKIYSHFNQNKLPSETFLKNTLEREFNLSSEWSEDFTKIFFANGRFAGIIQDLSGSPYVMLDSATISAGQTATQTQRTEDSLPQSEQAAGEVEVPKKGSETKPTKQPPEISQSKSSYQIPRIFISHSNNQEIVEQIKTMLDLADVDFEIAEEEESSAIPVPEKVFSAMRKCNAAVICVTVDEHEKREDGTHGINQNVLIEIGAAFVLYDKKVVLIWDKTVAVPSNLQGLYRCEFGGNELSWTAGMKLMKAVSGFKAKNIED